MKGSIADLVQRIKAADSEQSIEVFRKLLWAEAWASKISRSQIHVPSSKDCSDGGIDARVDGIVSEKGNVIFAPQTRYQIKSGKSFKPWTKTSIEEEFFGKKGKKAPSRQKLKAGIRNCLEAGGTYVLVCFGQDMEDKHRDKAEHIIGSFFTHECQYESPSFRVWDASDIAAFVEPYAGLCRDILGFHADGMKSHEIWSQDGEMRRHLELDDAQTQFVQRIQRELREGQVRHIRVCGEPGIGKTRLVLEATRDEDLSPLVAYWPLAEDFVQSNLYHKLVQGETQHPAILIVDECNATNRSRIWDDLEYRSDHIRLITIYHEFERTTGAGLVYPEVPALGEAHIAAIIRSYGVPKHLAQHFADLCSGSPRVAHVVGENLHEQSGDLTASPPKMQDVWRRYIAGGDADSETARIRTLVLTHLALFKRFGFKKPVAIEAEAIARMIEQADMQITWDRFQQVVRDLRNRKILQGGTTLYITPKLLHIWLWREWWETHQSGLNVEQFVEGLPGALFDWFGEMFRYAEESQAAAKQVDNLLGPDGLFQQGDFLNTDRGARFFFWLAEARPASAIACLERTVGNTSITQLRAFTLGRGYVVNALKKSAYLRDLFARSARLLLALGEAENKDWGNDASKAFAQLFSPGPGLVAPTEASPEERFPVLVESLESPSPQRRALGLSACRTALEADSFLRFGNDEFRGLNHVANPWSPQCQKEADDAYRRVWKYLRRKQLDLPPQQATEAAAILVEKGRTLIFHPALSELVLDTFEQLAAAHTVLRKELVTAVLGILQRERESLDEPTLHRLQKLQEQLSGLDFSSRLHRYVGMIIWDERIEDDDLQQLDQHVSQLAAEALSNRDALRAEYTWLFSSEAEDAGAFGSALARQDPDRTLLEELIDELRRAGENGNIGLLSGYLSVVNKEDCDLWERTLDQLAKDAVLAAHLPAITRQSGISRRAAERVLKVVRNGLASPLEFRHWCWGRDASQIPEDIFRQWVHALLESKESMAATVALNLARVRYCTEETLSIPDDLARGVLLDPRLFAKPGNGKLNRGRIQYDWTAVAERFLHQYPDEQIRLLNNVLQSWADFDDLLGIRYNKSRNIFDSIVRQNPIESWRHIARYLDDLQSIRTALIMQWLHGKRFFGSEGSGVIAVIPQDEIFGWVDMSPDTCAAFCAIRP